MVGGDGGRWRLVARSARLVRLGGVYRPSDEG